MNEAVPVVHQWLMWREGKNFLSSHSVQCVAKKLTLTTHLWIQVCGGNLNILILFSFIPFFSFFLFFFFFLGGGVVSRSKQYAVLQINVHLCYFSVVFNNIQVVLLTLTTIYMLDEFLKVSKSNHILTEFLPQNNRLCCV